MSRPTSLGRTERGTGVGPGGVPGAPPTPDCCSEDPPPDRGLNDNGAWTRSLLGGGPITLVQVKYWPTTNTDVVLDAPPTEGNLLVAWYADAQTSVGPHPPAFIQDVAMSFGTFGFKRAFVSHHVAGPGESATLGTFGEASRPIVAEFHHPDGWDESTCFDVGDIDKLNGGGDTDVSPAALPSITPSAGHRLLVACTSTYGSDPGDLTWPGHLTEIADDFNTSGGLNIGGGMAFADLDPASGAYNGNVNHGQYVAQAAYTPFGGGVGGVWAVPAPFTADGDDATYNTVEGTALLQRDLGAEYRIVSQRLRVETAGTGARTYTVTAWNELDQSDLVTLTSVSFTATGSPQDVVWDHLNTESYRYYQLDSDTSEEVLVYSWEMYEPTLATNHQHPASVVSYDNTASGLAADDVQEAIDELAAGAVTAELPWYDLVNDFGAACDNSTDDTAAWQDAIDTMAAAGGGRCLVPGPSLVAGALQDTGGANAQLVLPDIDYADAEAITLEFVGTWGPPAVPSVIGASPLNDNGPMLRSSLSSGTGAILAGWGDTGLDNFTNVKLVLRDLVVRTPANPTNSALDLSHVANVELHDVQVDAGSLNVAGVSSQTTATSYGIKLPLVNNGATVVGRQVNVIGFYNGVLVSEHADLDGVFVWASRRPWRFSGSYHASHLTRCGWYHCLQGADFISGPHTDESYFTWTHANIERADSGTWVQTGDDIEDASDFGFGRIEWHAVEVGTGVVHTFTKDGGATVWDLEIGNDPFGGAIDYGETGDITDLDFGDTADAGVLNETARADHRHGMPDEPSGGSGVGPILISDTPSTPLIFADLIQNEAQDDLVYADT